jgi:peroxiredoxin
LAAFEEKKQELADLGVKVFAASVDSEEHTAEVAQSGISFPLGHGVRREDGDALGSWWEEKRDFIQPSEFLFRRDGQILQSSYSSGPLARTLPEDVIALLGFIISRQNKKK